MPQPSEGPGVASVVIRPAVLSDAGAIAAVQVRSWQVAYRGQISDAYLDSLSIDERTTRWTEIMSSARERQEELVAEVDGEVVGFVSYGASRDEDAEPGAGELAALYLAPESWDTGIGHRLFTRAVDALQTAGFSRATLWVLKTNARARRFYEAHGWRPDGAHKEDRRPGVVLEEVRYRALVGHAVTVPVLPTPGRRGGAAASRRHGSQA